MLEALSLMRNENESYGEVFDNIALTTQQNLVTKMTSELLNLEFNVPLDEIEKNCKELFSNGEVFQAFLELLEIHSVSKSTIKKIKNGEKWFDDKLVNRYSIKSKKEGYLSAINQKDIGFFINIDCTSGKNEFLGNSNFYTGMIIRKRINDFIRKNEEIATIYNCGDIDEENILVDKFFVIS